MSKVGRYRGFTLLEMLVTLVLVGLVAGILSQALFQLSRVERLLAGGQMRSMGETVRLEWLRLALASMQAGEQGSPERFAGDARMLSGLSSAVPGYPSPGLATMQLKLRIEPNLGVTELVLIRHSSRDSGVLDSGGSSGDETILLSWAGQKGGFQYQDAAGLWVDSWPPSPVGVEAPPALPRLIRLETGLAADLQLLVAPLAVDTAVPSRRSLEQL